MSRTSLIVRRVITLLCALVAVLLTAPSQVRSQETAEKSQDATAKQTTAGEHKIERIHEILKRAEDGLARIKNEVRDYECIMTKRERVEGRLQPAPQYMDVKIRHEQKEGDKITVPFSVFLKFRKPTSIEGREVIFVQGRDNGDLIARRGGRRNPNMTVQLAPDGPMAMDGNRYPITEIGFVIMVERLIEVMKNEIQSEECEIKVFSNAKLNKRPCTHFELTMLKESPNSKFMKAVMFVDDEYRVPVYYAAYDWPEQEGGKPEMIEEYSYTSIKLNVGLTDKDFDTSNPDYNFSDLEDAPSGRDDG